MKKFLINTVVFVLVAGIIAFFAAFAMGYHPFVTISGSMEPVIHTGSLCYVDTNVEFEEIEKGDIVAFRTADGAAVTHRAITVTDNAIETKGDANDVSDGFTTSRDNFIGETIFSIPYLGYAVKYMQQPVGKVMVGVVILAIIAFMVIDNIEAKRKKEDEETAVTE